MLNVPNVQCFVQAVDSVAFWRLSLDMMSPSNLHYPVQTLNLRDYGFRHHPQRNLQFLLLDEL